MLSGVNVQLAAFLLILTVSLALLITERVRNDLVAILIILSLYLTGILKAEEALSGFSSEPAIVVAAIFVLTNGLERTGLSGMIGAWIGKLAGASYTRMIAVIMPSVALLSAFTHHVTTTAMMLPVTMDLARERDMAPSRLLMPISFAASLGTTITLIGAPAFLVASELLQRAGRPALGIFSIAPIGIALSVVGTLFTILLGRWLLPSRKGVEDTSARFRLDNYFTEITILSDSPLLGLTLDQVEEQGHFHFTVVGWVRGGRRVPRPYNERTLQGGDVLLVRTTPEEILSFRQDSGVELHSVEKFGAHLSNTDNDDRDPAESLVQAVIAPDSEFIGRSLKDIEFRRRYGAVVVSLWRQRGWIQQELSKVRLREGDVLVLMGSEEALGRVANDRGFLMLVPFHGETRPRGKAGLAGAIMLVTIVLAATNVVTLEMAALIGAVAMILTRCTTTRLAYRSIDARLYVFIAGAIPLGVAMQKTGLSQIAAQALQGAVAGLSPTIILLLVFAVVGVLTQFLSDAGTVAIFGPVAIALAQALGHSPEAYVVTTAMAAVASFLTPIGHHGNLLVYEPGGYKFSDFVRVGTPLTILVAVVVVLLAQVVWPG